jgi:DegV family protein with EDD domain
MRIRIVTDSVTNIPDEYLQRLNIIEAPAVVNFGQESYLYKVELSLAELYRRLASADRLPTTAGPPPRLFAEAYQRAADEGAEQIIVVTVSSRASGTYSNAMAAVEQSPVPVHVWDSLHISMAAGWQTIAAAEMVRDGLGVEAVMARLAALRGRIHMAFSPANLRYLVASGRVPRLRGAAGDFLNIKPIVVTQDGQLEPVAQVRTRHRAQEHMLDLVAAALGDAPVRMAVGHCNVPDDVAAFAERVRARFDVKEFMVVDLGMYAALGGPGVLGLTGHAVEDS